MMHSKGLQEDDIQKLHTTAPEQLTDQELLLSTIFDADLTRKHSGGWDKEHPKCIFYGKSYRFRTGYVSGKQQACYIKVTGRRQGGDWRLDTVS
jgi:hypothetical protein